LLVRYMDESRSLERHDQQQVTQQQMAQQQMAQQQMAQQQMAQQQMAQQQMAHQQVPHQQEHQQYPPPEMGRPIMSRRSSAPSPSTSGAGGYLQLLQQDPSDWYKASSPASHPAAVPDLAVSRIDSSAGHQMDITTGSGHGNILDLPTPLMNLTSASESAGPLLGDLSMGTLMKDVMLSGSAGTSKQ
jgi:type II secretory pathway pseudopilin PulG